MAHKYLNKLGVSSDEACIFNKEFGKQDSKKDRKAIRKQREKHGFAFSETWSMDYTLACWLYEHFKVYKKICIVDLDFHKFQLPVLDEETFDIDEANIREFTQREAIDLVCENLKPTITEDYASIEGEDEACKRMYYALRIVAEIMPAMWW